MTMIRLSIAAILSAGVLTGCVKRPDPERVRLLFNECMEKDQRRIGLSPTDECHRYAVGVATREANS